MDTALTTARADLSVVDGLGVRTETRSWPRPRLRPARTWALACLSVDSAMLALAAAATAVGGRAAGIASPPVLWTVAFGLLALAIFHARGLYALRLRLSGIDHVRTILAATTLAAMTILSLRLILGQSPDLAAESIRPWAFALVYVAAGRIALYWSQTRAREAGEALRPTLIVGAGRVGCLTAKRLLEHPELGLRPVAFLDKDPLADPLESLGIPVAGASWDLDSAIAQYGVQQVIVTFSTAPGEVLLRLVRRCEEVGVAVSVVPRLYERTPERLAIEHIGGLPLITAKPANPKSFQFVVKYALDRVLAAAILLLAGPVMAAVALAVRLKMGSPVLFRQLRVGRDGRTFECLKFRSMKLAPVAAPAPLLLPDGSAPGGVEGEDRRTRLGSFLRSTSLDELPQIFNVLRGEMSLVGPRPERPEFVSQFERSVYRYGERHRAKSGITGWAQVHGLRGKTSIADRAEWDNFYIENFSLWLDLKILFMTVAAVLGCMRQVE
jgi:exopolysaccharide biosynthesis polyprenyl glycosylphosphotransferase